MALQITAVRYGEPDARRRLGRFVFGGELGGFRVPRGIDPELVSTFLGEELEATSEPSAYAKTLEVVRFYERPDVVPTVLRALTLPMNDTEDLLRAAYAIQLVGDFGVGEALEQAVECFDAVVVPHPDVIELLPVLLETQVALAPAGTIDRLEQRVHAEVVARSEDQLKDEEAMIAFDTVHAIERNDLPRAKGTIERKRELLDMPPDQRRDELVTIYLGMADVSSDQMEIWAARLLRLEAMQVDATPVHQAFERALDDVDSDDVGKETADFMIVRAGQAVEYLGGHLSHAHKELFDATEDAAMNFLWDDPGTWVT